MQLSVNFFDLHHKIVARWGSDRMFNSSKILVCLLPQII